MIAFKKTPVVATHPPKIAPTPSSGAPLRDEAIENVKPSETDKDRHKRIDTSGARRRMRETVEGNRLL